VKITFLGTGTSHGVPSIDCMINDFRSCPQGVCKLSETDPGHNRTRSSILVEWDGFSLLIDVSADFRQQVLRESVKKIDSVLITHGHADHVTGIPDIRSYTREKPVPLYGSEESVDMIRKSYSYVFEYPPCTGGGIPQLITNKVDSPFYLSDQKVIPVLVGHGDLKGCFGYRIGPLAYIPDMRTIDDENLKKLEGTEILVLNCLRREKEHPTHLILPQSVEFARRISPRRCYFIHMCHDIHYELDSRNIDPFMEFSRDGLKVEI
jgi:phosphoribosyl 1,2-cyclic phosphate phosphodiesterase